MAQWGLNPGFVVPTFQFSVRAGGMEESFESIIGMRTGFEVIVRQETEHRTFPWGSFYRRQDDTKQPEHIGLLTLKFLNFKYVGMDLDMWRQFLT